MSKKRTNNISAICDFNKKLEPIRSLFPVHKYKKEFSSNGQRCV